MGGMWSQLVQYQIFYKKKAFSKKSFRFGHSSSFWLTQNGHKWPLWPLRCSWGVRKWSQWISHGPKPRYRHQNQVSSMFRTKARRYRFGHSSLFWLTQNGHKWPLWPPRCSWGVWKWSQWISYGPKPRNRHQNQVSSMFRTKISDLAILAYFG